MDAIASRLGADVNDGITLTRSFGIKDLVFAHESKSECIHERIAGVALFKLRLAAQIGNTKAVPVRGDAAHDPLKDGMIFVKKLLSF